MALECQIRCDGDWHDTLADAMRCNGDVPAMRCDVTDVTRYDDAMRCHSGTNSYVIELIEFVCILAYKIDLLV